MAKRKRTPRDNDISKKEKIRDELTEIFQGVSAGFSDQRDRADENLDFWDLYNSVLNEKQSYNSDAKIFVPIIHDAVNARTIRFTNQAFPESGRYVECISENGDFPNGQMSLMEHYVRKAKLRTQVAPALLRNGDVEGQYSIYVSWERYERHIVWRGPEPVKVQGMEIDGLGEVETIHQETIVDEGPCVEVLADSDILVLPVTSASIEEALNKGGSVTVIRRWTKSMIQDKIDDGTLDKDAGEALLESMTSEALKGQESVQEQLARSAGIHKGEGDIMIAIVYETWTKLKVDGAKRLCRAYFAGGENILGAKRNPYWCDKCPIISAPVEKVAGVFKGISKLNNVASVQYFANDIINEAADSATMSMLPIVFTDPEKNPKIGTMVLDKAAVWETNPKDTQFAQFPPIWRDGFEVVSAAKNQIFQTLSVAPAMIPQQASKGNKRNQAEIAAEQQADILSTSDAVAVLEESILTPMIQLFQDLDAQYRDDELTIRSFGEMGMRIEMERIPVFEYGKRYELIWYGVEVARDAARIQQQIAVINVARGVPPALYPGYQLNIAPVMNLLIQNAFGPRMAPQIFKSIKDQLAVDPEMENKLLLDAQDVYVHLLDDDPKHIETHMQLLETGDPNGVIREHIEKHKLQIGLKSQGIVQSGANTAPGTPGDQMPQTDQPPGIAGVPGQAPRGGAPPRMGAQPQGPRLLKGPPGAIPADRMARAGSTPMPRRA